MADEESIKREEEALRRLMDLRSDYTSVLQEESKQVLVYTKAKKALAAAEKAGAENVAELRETVETYRASLSETETDILEMTEQIEKQSEALKAQREALAKSQKRMASFKSGVDALTDSNISSIMSLEGFAANVLKVTFALEDLGIQIGRQTGYTTTFRDNLTNITQRNAELAISLAESSQIIIGLSTGMARFNMLGDAQQSVLEDISARFMRLGVDTKAFGEVMDTVNYSFGLTGQAAAEAAKGLESVASQVGRPLDSVVSDLNEIGPSLARFGQDGLRVFSKLAVQARELGLTTKQAFDVSELFDTFEGAANIAGRLNAQLGLQLNSVEMMKASSEERIELLRDEFQLQGLQFESMGRRQRQMIAGILGQDEETAARLLGGKMDISAFQKEPEEKTITDMVKMQEKMNHLMEQLGMMIAPYLLSILNFIKQHFHKFVEWAPTVVGLLAAMKAASFLKGLGPTAAGAGISGGLAGMFTKEGLKQTVKSGAASGFAGRVPIVGGLLAGGLDMLMGESFGRSAAGAIGGIAGGFAGLLGGGGIASIPLAAAGGYGGQKAGKGIYDAIFGAPQPPATNNADMARATDPSRRSRGDANLPNITMPVTLEVDGKQFAKTTVNVMNHQLRLTSQN